MQAARLAANDKYGDGKLNFDELKSMLKVQTDAEVLSIRREFDMDDDGNILASGKPLPDGGTVPEYGGERARKQLWGVLVKSKNETMTSRWLRSCDAATAFAEDGTLDHDEL